MKSWKTTIAGILAGVGILIAQVLAYLDGNDATSVEWSQITLGLGAIGFGIFARDNDKTSEDAGAK